MTFVHPLLLGGLLLVGIPVVLHLIMQQKPKHMLFPAFRFLQERHRTNQRTLRLRHLLLLLLRILLIALICLALARPKLQSENAISIIGTGQPVAMVLLVDTSYSMDYKVAGRSRLDEAKRRVMELLADLPEGSRVAVFDSAEAGGEWSLRLAQARERAAALKPRFANAPLTRQLEQAYRLFDQLERERGTAEEPLPRLLYLFSDRTQECWDAAQAANMKQPDGVRAAFVDVGVEQPADVAIVSLEFPPQMHRDLPRQVFGTADRFVLRAGVRSTGGECNTELVCRLDKKEIARKPIVLDADQSKTIAFDIDCQALKVGYHEIEVELRSSDSLPFNNTRYATFQLRGGRQVLVLCDDLKDAYLWDKAMSAVEAFKCDVKTPVAVRNLGPKDLLKSYKVICLLDVAHPDPALWEMFKAYVETGGGLAIIPGGDELRVDRYNDARSAGEVMPAQLVRIIELPEEKALPWTRLDNRHALTAPFFEWSKTRVDFQEPAFLPRASRYWQTNPLEGKGSAIVNYVALDKEKANPALLERTLGRGHVLLFTTALDGRRPLWNNYLTSSFYLVLANKAVGYLAGDLEERSLNLQNGETVTIDATSAAHQPVYILQGPGLSGAESSVPRAVGEDRLLIQTLNMSPGNFQLLDSSGGQVAAFSLNVRPEESQLTRVPVEQIEALLGKDAVLSVGRDESLPAKLQGRFHQPVELFPWLMILLLLALAVENLLANRFYRKPAGANAPQRPMLFSGSPQASAGVVASDSTS
jgi:hypothetical protein